MNKDNLLFAIIGVLLGFIAGFMLAGFMNQRDQMPRASGPGQQAQSLPPNHPPLDGESGGDPQQIFAQVQAAMKRAKDEPSNFNAQFEAAQLEYQIRNYDMAIDFLVKANQLQPDHYGAIASLGMVNMDAGHFDAAEKWYRKALLKKADDVTVLDGLCAVLLSKGDAKAAEAAINNLAKIDPENQDLPQFRNKLAELRSSTSK